MWLGYSTQLFNQIPIWVLLWWYSVDKINIYFIGCKWRLSSHSAAWLCPVSWTVLRAKLKFPWGRRNSPVKSNIGSYPRFSSLPFLTACTTDLRSAEPAPQSHKATPCDKYLPLPHTCVCVSVFFLLQNFEKLWNLFSLYSAYLNSGLCIYLYIWHFSWLVYSLYVYVWLIGRIAGQKLCTFRRWKTLLN